MLYALFYTSNFFQPGPTPPPPPPLTPSKLFGKLTKGQIVVLLSMVPKMEGGEVIDVITYFVSFTRYTYRMGSLKHPDVITFFFQLI